MKSVDWIVVAILMLMLMVIAIVSSRRMKAPVEYYTGGRRAGLFQLIMFSFGSGTSADSQGSVMSGAWRAGLSGLWWQFLWLPITPFYWILAPLLRRLRAVTTADFFAMRFGRSTSLLYSIYGMIICVVLMAGILFASARLLNVLMDPFFSNAAAKLHVQIPSVDVRSMFLPPAVDRPPILTWRALGGEGLAAASLGLMLAVCGVIGGLNAAVVTDVIQGCVRILLTLVLLPVMFHRIGGFGVLHTFDALKPGMFDFVVNAESRLEGQQDPFTLFYLCMLAVAGLAGVIAQPHIMTMCGAGRGELDARIGFTFGNLLKRCVSVLWAFLALACVAWYLGPSTPLDGPASTPADRELLVQLREVADGSIQSKPPDEQAKARTLDARFADRLFGRMVRDLTETLPGGLRGLFAAIVIAAAVSHCGTQMIVASGLFAEHFYKQQIRPGMEPHHYLTIGRLCGPVLVLAALILQMSFSNISDVLRLVIKTPAVIGISMWMGLIWTRWNTASVWVTTIVSAGMGILCGYFPDEVQRTFPGLSHLMFTETPQGPIMMDAWKILLILTSGLSAGILGTFVTDLMQDSQLEYFYRVIRTPVSPDEATYGEDYQPPDDKELLPCVAFWGFQLPGPTRGGLLGFTVAWLVVGALVLLTKWVSLIF
ncbi:MAG: hypothetical protein U0996_19240 [Planctomycetaceae bacterium]